MPRLLHHISVRYPAWSACLEFAAYFRIGRSFCTLEVSTSPKKVLKTALKAFQLALTA